MNSKEKRFLWCIVGSEGDLIRLPYTLYLFSFNFYLGGKPVVSLYLVWVLAKKKVWVFIRAKSKQKSTSFYTSNFVLNLRPKYDEK